MHRTTRRGEHGGTHLGLLVHLLALADGIVRGGLACLAELCSLLLQALFIRFPLRMGILLVGQVVVAAACSSETDDYEQSCVASTAGLGNVGGVGTVGGLRGIRDRRIRSWPLRKETGVSWECLSIAP